VDIVASRRGEWYEIAVTDNGEGIASDLLTVLFERFRQADGSATRRHGGLGLGLAIVRHLVELHGGRVVAESDGLGKGTTIRVSLPIISDPAAGLDVTIEKHASPQGAPLASVLSGMTALLVDDEASARDLMCEVLQSHGAIVHAGATAPESLKLWAEAKPSIVLLDVGMPDVDGYTLLERLRSEPFEAGRYVPAIAVTGYAQESDRRRALAAGFDAHVTKPFDIESLVTLVARLAGPAEPL
jgi:CheY-like chemotaxis protein